ncbi:hypothetical protein JOB18_002256 [Solea senegalensis]|uniref:Uncharacterized protein n=1 Tax=Solea senegalensis TaxID=28829 RepID=A0AAV6QLW5_SOLSE|nr:hypothetical protein JOB18_002256 [Solea senegalensis]
MPDKGDGSHVGRNQPPLLILPNGDRPTATQLTNTDIAVLNRLWNHGIDPFTYNRHMNIMQQDRSLDDGDDSDSSSDDLDFSDDRENLLRYLKTLFFSGIPLFVFVLFAWSVALIVLDFLCTCPHNNGFVLPHYLCQVYR